MVMNGKNIEGSGLVIIINTVSEYSWREQVEA
jgi:hypothetical protein